MAIIAWSRTNDPVWRISGGEPPAGEVQADFINPSFGEVVRPPEGGGIITGAYCIGDNETFCNGDLVRFDSTGCLVELTAGTQTVGGVALECADCSDCDDLTPPGILNKRVIALPNGRYAAKDVNGTAPTEGDVGTQCAIDLTNGNWTIDISNTGTTDVEITDISSGRGLYVFKFLNIQDPFTAVVAKTDGDVSNVVTLGTTYAALRNGSPGTLVDDTSAGLDITLIADSDTDEWTTIERAIVIFDVSGISKNQTISAATFDFHVVQAFDTFTAAATMALVNCVATVSDTVLSLQDYNNPGSTAHASQATLASLNTGATVNNLSLNTAGIAALNTALQDDGIYRMGIRLGWDVDNDPTWEASAFVLFSIDSLEDSVVTKRPQLSLTHADT